MRGGEDVDVPARPAVAPRGRAVPLEFFAVEGDAAVTAVAWGVSAYVQIV